MLSFRKAFKQDEVLYFNWVNDANVREQSFNSKKIDFQDHQKWFDAKLKDSGCLMLVFQNEDKINIGQVRIQKENEINALIGISIDEEHRGKGYASDMLRITSDFFFKFNLRHEIIAYIKMENESSKYAFEKAGFIFERELIYENYQSLKYVKRLK